VFDLTGNIQEWVGSTAEQAVLVGGAWFAQDKSSCGAAGTRFGPGYENRSTGFRCCADGSPGTATAAKSLAPETHGVQVGEALPSFAGEDLGGIGVSTEQIMGKVGLINFWASWCAPCQRELPFLVRMQEEYGPSGFQVISVNVDRIPDKARPWIARFNLPFPVMVDPDAEVMGLFDVMAMPTSVLVDMDGNVLEVHTGFSDAWAKSLRIRLTEMLE
jgi:thiol-disulfide isomerase/thioredoxin